MASKLQKLGHLSYFSCCCDKNTTAKVEFKAPSVTAGQSAEPQGAGHVTATVQSRELRMHMHASAQLDFFIQLGSPVQGTVLPTAEMSPSHVNTR